MKTEDEVIDANEPVSAKRLSAFGVRSSRPRSPNGLQNMGVPGVLEEGERASRDEDAVWLVNGRSLLVHNAHLQDGRGRSNRCTVCFKGPGAILANVKNSGAGYGVVQSPGADEEGSDTLPSPRDQPERKGGDVSERRGKVRAVEGNEVSALDWFGDVLGAHDESDVGGGDR